jgi:hypothetical protein
MSSGRQSVLAVGVMASLLASLRAVQHTFDIGLLTVQANLRSGVRRHAGQLADHRLIGHVLLIGTPGGRRQQQRSRALGGEPALLVRTTCQRTTPRQPRRYVVGLRRKAGKQVGPSGRPRSAAHAIVTSTSLSGELRQSRTGDDVASPRCANAIVAARHCPAAAGPEEYIFFRRGEL